MKRVIPLFFAVLFISCSGYAADWQWSVEVKGVISNETTDHPTAFLWIPPNCKQVRGVVVGQHNMLEEGILEHTKFRKTLTQLGFAEVWVSPFLDPVFDFNGKAGLHFNEMMKSLADISGYSELAFAPIVPIGHSAAASYPWNFAAWNPERTLAVLAIHGDAPLTNMTGSGRPNPDWGKRSIDGIPGLIVIGEYEWLEGRILPAIQFKKDNPQSTIALLADAGRGHFDYSDGMVEFLCMFIKKAAKARLPSIMPLEGPASLKAASPQKGWLVDRWRLNEPLSASANSFHHYSGNRDEAFWAFDKEMARATEKYYCRSRGKVPQYIGYTQQGKLLPGAGSFVGYRPVFTPLEDGFTFHVNAAFIDSAQSSPQTNSHAKGKITISRICGPIQKVNDTTFTIRFYRMGLNNSKRTGDIWLMASHPGDRKYKSAVQQANIKIPLRNVEGAEQAIDFPQIPDQNHSVKSLTLNASSSAGVPVYYYVKEGPAELSGNILKFNRIPVRTKFPVKVTIVAWQWGYKGGVKLKSAEPVERNFYIHK
ncbi:hypothetical protein WG906_04615 [Pedobacter sp. P351]|uniref:hypothetical protein n=1 Tax=Pedobacter superstes TaxID=3133441 RepID=UPI0030966966